MPADLLVRRYRCRLLKGAGRAADLDREASALAADIEAGRWLLSRDAWELVVSELREQFGRAMATDPRRVHASVAAEMLASGPLVRSRHVLVADGAILTVLAEHAGSTRRAVLSPSVTVDRWLDAATAQAAPGVAIGLHDEDGRPIGGRGFRAEGGWSGERLSRQRSHGHSP